MMTDISENLGASLGSISIQHPHCQFPLVSPEEVPPTDVWIGEYPNQCPPGDANGFVELRPTLSVVTDGDLLEAPLRKRSLCCRWLSIAGPGLVVMLADTDAGCIVTAAQTGATWGYSMLWLQLSLIVVIYMAQELTARLGVHTGLGHGELIHKHYGRFWAWVSAATLVVACTGALVSEMSGVVGVGNMFGIPPSASACSAAAFVMLVVITGKYRHVEKVALLLGFCELTYFVTMILTFSGKRFTDSVGYVNFADGDYDFLISANIGAVVMPWMIFYQQSAIVDKGLQPSDLPAIRMDTALGAFLTQMVMTSVICTTAGTIWNMEFPNNNAPQNIGDFSASVEAKLGVGLGRALFSIGLIGGAMIAAIVVALTAAWGLGEVAGFKHSLEQNPKEAPWFYVVFGLCVCIGVATCLSPVNLVMLNIIIQVMNALLLPVVLGLLFMLARNPDILPENVRLRGWYMVLSGVVYLITAGVGVGGGLFGIITGRAG